MNVWAVIIILNTITLYPPPLSPKLESNNVPSTIGSSSWFAQGSRRGFDYWFLIAFTCTHLLVFIYWLKRQRIDVIYDCYWWCIFCLLVSRRFRSFARNEIWRNIQLRGCQQTCLLIHPPRKAMNNIYFFNFAIYAWSWMVVLWTWYTRS